MACSRKEDKIKNKSKKKNSKKPSLPSKRKFKNNSERKIKGKTSASNRSNKRKNTKTAVGVLKKTTRGYGFVVIENQEKDTFVAFRNMNGAMNGDTVEISIYPDSRTESGFEGRVDRVIDRAVKSIVGTFERNKYFGFVMPDDKLLNEEILINKKHFNRAKRGDKVLVEITKYPDKSNAAEGKIKEIISVSGEQGGDAKAIIRSFGIQPDFPQKVLTDAEKLNEKFKIPEGRRDLRNKKIFTIDGADSKDFDDAVQIEKLPNGNYVLGVHIADVTHYVTENSPLDKEALNRGTSIYLPHLVIPMLPNALSNGICSLKEAEDRLTLSVNMEIDKDGNVVGHEIYESIICSSHRLIYDDVSDLLENNDEKQREALSDIAEDLFLMKELAAILREKKEERGSIDFDLDEAKIIISKDGETIEISATERRTANKLIEEFMLLTNETIAKQFVLNSIPFVYRVHERPSTEKISELKTFLNGFELSLSGDPETVKPLAYSNLLKSIKGTPEENIISTIALRSMSKAIYSPECLGHFGLALKNYCHFTSPIRRYPDLIIHRIIKESIKGKIAPKRFKELRGKVEYAAKQSSETEERAIKLEREIEKLMKAEYMNSKIGERFPGIISGMTSYGVFVSLQNTVEGLIRMRNFTDDYYEYNPETYSITGRHKGKKYSLGDKIDIIVENVNLENREIDFSPAD